MQFLCYSVINVAVWSTQNAAISSKFIFSVSQFFKNIGQVVEQLRKNKGMLVDVDVDRVYERRLKASMPAS